MATMTITIRPATASDAPIIASALAMALGEASMKMYCGENYREVLKELARMAHTIQLPQCTRGGRQRTSGRRNRGI